METRILNDLKVHGAFIMADNLTDFPANPSIGTFVVKNQCLYGYIKIGGMETWYPFANKTNSYIHTQGLASTTWTVNHNLGTSDIWYQVKDQNGNIVMVSKADVNNNTFTLNFTEATLGTCVVVAPDTVDVPQVKASLITVGADNVVIDTSGVRVNGSYVLTSANITQQIDDAVAVETSARIAADNTLRANIASEITARAAADATLQTQFNNNIDQSVKTTASPTFAGLTTTGHIIPSADVTYDLGSTTNRFRDLYLSGSTIFLGDGTISYDSLTNAFNFVNPSNEPAKVDLSANTTDNLSEGTTNLYHTTARAAAAAPVQSVAGRTGAVVLAKSDVGLSNVDNTADANKVVASAGKLTTARTVALSGDVTGSVTFDGSADVTVTTAVADNSHDHTIANVTGLQTALDSKQASLGFTPENSANKGAANGYASLDAGGKVPAAQLPSYVDDVLEYANQAGFPTTGETAKIYVALDTNKIYRWSGSAYIEISPTAGNADTATKLATARTVALSGDVTGSVTFDGSADVTITTAVADDSHAHSFANITSKPTTLSGYGITDAAPSSHVGATGTAHGVATTSVAGFMSSTDKTKLDGIATGANNYSLPVATTTVLGGVKDGTGVTIAADGTVSVDYGSASGTAVQGNDARVTADQAANVASIRTIGTGALQAAAGNHNHTIDSLSNVVISANSDNEVLAWDSASSKWINQTAAEAGLAASGHTHTIANVTGLQTALDTETTARTAADATLQANIAAEATARAAADATLQASISSHTHTLSIGDGSTAKISVATNERLDIAAGTNVSVAYDDATNKVTISTTGTLTGNADTATKLQTARTVALSGDVTGSVSFDGSADVTITTAVADDSHAHSFANITSKPTTLSGYGITDAQPLDADLTAIAALSNADGNFIVGNGTTWVVESGATVRTSLGLGDSATKNVGTTSGTVAAGDHNHTIDGLSNVVITANSDNEVLAWDSTSSKWINQTAAEAGLATSGHTHNYAGSSTAGGAANSVANSQVIKFDTGTTEGTDLYTFNGSAAKTIDFKAGTNISIAKAAGVITISANDTSVNWSEVQSKPTTLSGYGITDAYTKTEVDAFVQGLDPKASVVVATTANITLSGTQTIDGVAVIAGDRVLVKDQTTASQNGIYVVAAGAWTRAADADAWTELPGAYVFVEKGTTNAEAGFVCTSDAGGTLGTTAVTFVQFTGAGQITAGNGLTKTGNTIDVVGTSGRIVANADAIDLATVTQGTGSNFVKITVDSYGRVSGNTAVAASDVTGLSGFLSSTAGAALAASGSAGTSTTVARADHVHPIPSLTSLGAQATLVSGTNIKTINGATVLGSGDLVIQGGIEFTAYTANVTAVNKQGIIANTTAGSFTVTLPATPSTGHQVVVVDGANWAANPLTIGRNGSTIEGLAEDLVLDISGAAIQFIYNGSTWQVYAQVGGMSTGTRYARYIANMTAVDGQKIIADTSGGSFTVTLPASPTVGYQVNIVDGANWATNALTVDRNGSTIEGVADNLLLDIEGSRVELIYTGTTWKVYA